MDEDDPIPFFMFGVLLASETPMKKKGIKKVSGALRNTNKFYALLKVLLPILMFQ
ncbi:MAG: hypothetical protein IJD43_00605 [Thermoguttaceae bacterium]|nr:hypothetical protein [Thermoguttaceae bacterium]